MLVPRSLKLSLRADMCLCAHLLQCSELQCPSPMTLSRSRIELDLASMIFCKRHILNVAGNWSLRVRADSSPQGGRDFFCIEADVCTFCPDRPFHTAANRPVAELLGEGRFGIKTRLLPLQIIGCRAASAVHKAQHLIKSLALESEDLQTTLNRTATLMFDFGAEAGIWSMPASAASAAEASATAAAAAAASEALALTSATTMEHRLFPNALPVADCDHALHHAPR